MKSEPQKIIWEVRRERLRQLIRDCGGKQVALVEEITNRTASRPDLAKSLKAFMDTTYVSSALKGRKNIGDEPADALEIVFGYPRGWMSDRGGDWPFKFSRTLWEDLSPEQRALAEQHLLLIINGLQSPPAQTEQARPRTRKTGN